MIEKKSGGLKRQPFDFPPLGDCLYSSVRSLVRGTVLNCPDALIFLRIRKSFERDLRLVFRHENGVPMRLVSDTG
jgi:hypothetical protein